MRRDGGLTLIALIITIIVMLILAGVALVTLTGKGSIITNAETTMGEYNNKVIAEQETLNEIIEYIKNDGNVDNTGISISATPDTTGLTKKVVVTIVGKADNGIKSFTSTAGVSKTYASVTKEIVETCEITSNGVYIFTIENINGKTASKGIVISNIDNLPPKVFTPSAISTSNSITVNGSTIDQEESENSASSGIGAYYYRIDNGEWKTNTNLLETSYTFTGLTQGTSHTLQMKAVDKVGNEVLSSEIIKETITIAGESSIKIEPDKTEVTKDDVIVTVTYPNNISGLIKEISIDNGKTWTEYTQPVSIGKNCTVKARLRDVENQTGTAASLTISNIDKNKPIVIGSSVSKVFDGTPLLAKDYFQIYQNGIAEIVSIVYSSEGRTEPGTTSVICTVTKETGLSASAEATLTITPAPVVPEEPENPNPENPDLPTP